MRDVETRYWATSGVKLAPPEPPRMMGGVMTAADQPCPWRAGSRCARRKIRTTGQHGKRMLEAQDQRQQHGHAVVEPEEGGGLAGLLREGEIGREEEGIVIVAYEPVPMDIRQRAAGDLSISNRAGGTYLVVKVLTTRRNLSDRVFLGPRSGPILSGPSMQSPPCCSLICCAEENEVHESRRRQGRSSR